VLWQDTSASDVHAAAILIEGSFPRVKRAWREADHSPPSSAKVKNAWNCTFTPHMSSGVLLN
jgi:hypothetical protein